MLNPIKLKKDVKIYSVLIKFKTVDRRVLPKRVSSFVTVFAGIFGVEPNKNGSSMV